MRHCRAHSCPKAMPVKSAVAHATRIRVLLQAALIRKLALVRENLRKPCKGYRQEDFGGHVAGGPSSLQ